MWKIICLTLVIGCFLPSTNALCDVAKINTCLTDKSMFNTLSLVVPGINIDILGLAKVCGEGYLYVSASSTQVESPNGGYDITLTIKGHIKLTVKQNLLLALKDVAEVEGDIDLVIKLNVVKGTDGSLKCTFISMNIEGCGDLTVTLLGTIPLAVSVDELKAQIEVALQTTFTEASKIKFLPAFCKCLQDGGACS